jgi:exodeoxyribonuclease V gamma subunit
MVIQAATCENAMPTGFSVIHSNRMEDLRQVAVQWIRSHPLKPLENELFMVQSNGMAQWLELALAENSGCGISTALDIQLPARFLWQAYRAVLGEAIPRQSPYNKVRLVWRLLRLLPEALKDDGFAPLQQYLADDADQRKRFQLACHIADLYDQYQVYRADWLEDWSSGTDQLRNAMGEPLALPAEQAWQAKLWRRIQNDVPEQQRGFNRSGLHQHFLAAAQALTVRPADLPRRVIVFGINSLPKQALETLHAVSRLSQVLLFVHNPCRHYWADIIEDRELLRIENARHKRKSPSLANLNPELLHQHVNPLLAAWAKQGRDYIGLLYGFDQPDTYRENFAEIDLFSDFTEEGRQADLLQQVQQAILELKPLPGANDEKQLINPQDHSICFHLAHCRQREVEILQDQLLDLFGQNPDLKPQDVIVMTPDIDAYAPHIEAVFGNAPSYDPRYIPFTIADRPESTSVPMLQALENLLQLPSSRMAAGDLMDLLEVPAFRKRFGLVEEDLHRLHRWIQGAGIRWGLNAEQRRDFDLPAGIEQNTWLFGLRRMLLGYAVGSNDPWRGIEPYDDIGGLEAALVGPLAVIVERLEACWRMLRQPATAQDWRERIVGLMQDFFLPANSHDELTQRRIEEVVEQWLSACNDANLQEALTLPVVREALMGEMRDASVSQRFLAGRINFCLLMPMRAIPFKVVCLLGMNDGQYPRSAPPLDFNLMSGPGRYRPGDRSRREDDRYLWLEALLSAREKLYISYIGNSAQDNSERMPSVLVGQLRDYLAAGWRVPGPAADTQEANERLLDQLTCRHPLQPFSKNYFQTERRPCLFTYAREWRDIYERPAEPSGVDRLKTANFEGPVQLNHLIRFLKNPIKNFFNQRLGIYFDDIDVTAQNQEPFHLDSLAPFGAGMQLLAAGLEASPEKSTEAVVNAAQRLQRTGELPHGGFGEQAAELLTQPVLRMLGHHHDLCHIWNPETSVVEIRFPVQLPGSTCDALEDWLDGIHNAVARTPAASKDPEHARWEFYPLAIMDTKGLVSPKSCLIIPWVKHLAGCSQGLTLTSYLIAPDGCAMLTPVDRPTAQQWLHHIIRHWWQGLEYPLPVTAKTAMAYLAAPPSGNLEATRKKAREAARKAYEGDGYHHLGELGYGDGAYLKRCYTDFDALWDADTKDNGFEKLAGDLYAPLVEAVGKGAEA